MLIPAWPGTKERLLHRPHTCDNELLVEFEPQEVSATLGVNATHAGMVRCAETVVCRADYRSLQRANQPWWKSAVHHSPEPKYEKLSPIQINERPAL